MSRWTLPLVLGAAFTNGLLAGGNVDRLLVATPAWEEVGLNRWADFSRAADLRHGQIFYPAMALGSTALAVLAAATLLRKPRAPRVILLPMGLSAGFMIIALPFSLEAVPFMQSLRSIHDGDVAALNQAFAGAHFWGSFQGYFHIAAFCSELWAVAVFARFGRRAALDAIVRTTPEK
jgi:hypothetical protein